MALFLSSSLKSGCNDLFLWRRYCRLWWRPSVVVTAFPVPAACAPVGARCPTSETRARRWRRSTRTRSRSRPSQSRCWDEGRSARDVNRSRTLSSSTLTGRRTTAARTSSAEYSAPAVGSVDGQRTVPRAASPCAADADTTWKRYATSNAVTAGSSGAVKSSARRAKQSKNDTHANDFSEDYSNPSLHYLYCGLIYYRNMQRPRRWRVMSISW